MPLLRLLAVPALAIVTLAGARRAMPPSDGEVRRIRAHFDSVLTDLAARQADALTHAQRGQRSALMHTLRTYRDRGMFPHNYDFPGAAVPYFVDRKTGTLCAVAHLLAVSGRRDIVDRVARSDNNVWVQSLAADTAFTAWLDTHGLTLDEAARIQVPYESPNQAQVKAQLVGAMAVFGGSVLGSVGTGIWNATSNADGHRKAPVIIGFATGALSVGIGTLTIGSNNSSVTAVGAGFATVGGLSILSASRALRHRHQLALKPASAVTNPGRETSVVPLIGIGSGHRSGLALSLRF